MKYFLYIPGGIVFVLMLIKTIHLLRHAAEMISRSMP
jgi:hypothetical protein